MGHAGFYSCAVQARWLIAANRRLPGVVHPEQRTGKRNGQQKNLCVIRRVYCGSCDLQALRQADFRGRHMVATRLLHRFILRQPPMHNPGKDRQKHDKQTDAESAPIAALPGFIRS